MDINWGEVVTKKQSASSKNKSLNFSEALDLLKRGLPLSRSSWGEEAWVMIPNAQDGLPYAFTTGLNAAIARMNSGYAELDCFFVLKKGESQFDIGWMPVISDLLASDWFLYNKDIMWKHLPHISTPTYS